MNITKKKFNNYRRVQYSGITNMFAVNVVMYASGLSRKECLFIMSNYEELEKKHGKYEEK
jgi:hypothetical protein